MPQNAKKTVFISHSSQDAAVAMAIVDELERRNIRCWIAPRDIRPGTNYAEELLYGITSCDAMIVLISANALNSTPVALEVERATNARKTIYPVRIERIELTGGLQFFLSLQHRIDLIGGLDQDAIDLLSESIQASKFPRSKSHNKINDLSTTKLVTMIGAAGVMAVSIFVMFYYASSVTERASDATTSGQSSSIATSNMHVDIWYAPDDGLALTNTPLANAYLQGFPVQAAPISVEIFDDKGNGRAQKVADTQVRPKMESGHQSFQVPVAVEPKTGSVCINFLGLDKSGASRRYYFTRHLFPLSSNKSVTTPKISEATPDVSCKILLGFTDIDDATAPLADYDQKQRIENGFSFAEIYHVGNPASNQTGFRITLYAIGGSNSAAEKNFVPDVTLFAYASDDGKNWRSYYKSDESLEFKTLRYEYIRRPAPKFLLVCAATFISKEKVFVVESGQYRRLGVEGQYNYSLRGNKSRGIHKTDQTCRGIDPANAQKPTHPVLPLEIAVPENSGGTFDRPEIQSLRNGRPVAYGPKLAGLRLGMSFDEAKRAAGALLPLGSAVTATSTLPGWHGKLFGEFFAVIDLQAQQSIVLASHPNVKALAGMWWGYRPFQKRMIDLKKFKQRLTDTFGSFSLSQNFTDYVAGSTSGPDARACGATTFDMPVQGWDSSESHITGRDLENSFFLMQITVPERPTDTPCGAKVSMVGRWPRNNPTFVVALENASALLALKK